MFMITINGRTYIRNNIETAAGVIFSETGDAQDYERMQYIMGNMKIDESFHGKRMVIQCYKEDTDND